MAADIITNYFLPSYDNIFKLNIMVWEIFSTFTVVLAMTQPVFFNGFLKIKTPTGKYFSFQKSFHLLNASSCECFKK